MKTTSTIRGAVLLLVTVGVVAAVWMIPHPGWSTLETALLSGLRLTVMTVTVYVGMVVALTLVGVATRNRFLRRVTDAITVPALGRVIATTLLLTPAVPLIASAAPASELPDEAVGLPVFDEPTPPTTSPRSPRQVVGWAKTDPPDDTSTSTQPERAPQDDHNHGRAPNEKEPNDSGPKKLDRNGNDRTQERNKSQKAQQPGTLRYVVQPGDNLWDITHAVMIDHQEEPPTTSEHATYWARVCDEVTAQLSSGDPDLIYPGETLIIPRP